MTVGLRRSVTHFLWRVTPNLARERTYIAPCSLRALAGSCPAPAAFSIVTYQVKRAMSNYRRRPLVNWNPLAPPQPRKRVFSVTPPARVISTDLRELLAFYDGLCTDDIRDPRGHRVLLSPERFPHLIDLKEPNGRDDVRNPQKEVVKIRSGERSNSHFGGFQGERAETLSWIRATVEFPTMIVVRSLIKGIHAGKELYYKEFDRFGGKLTLLVCRRVGPELLVPVTWFPKDRGPKAEEVIYHALEIKVT